METDMLLINLIKNLEDELMRLKNQAQKNEMNEDPKEIRFLKESLFHLNSIRHLNTKYKRGEI